MSLLLSFINDSQEFVLLLFIPSCNVRPWKVLCIIYYYVATCIVFCKMFLYHDD